jgi:hypothetical protein
MYTDEFAKEITRSFRKNESDIKKAAEGIAKLLLKDKTNYLLFGPYWWAVKTMIKKYTSYHEWFTGGYMDSVTFHRAWHGTELETMSAAIYYQQEQIMKTSGHSVIVDGEDVSYTLYDEDAGL